VVVGALSVRRAEDLSREWSSCGTGMEGSDWPTERGLRRGSRAEPLSNVTFILASTTPQFAYDLAMHRVSSCGTHRVMTHSRKMRFSAHWASCATSPALCSSKEACSEEQRTIVSRRWSTCHNGCAFWPLHPEHDFQLHHDAVIVSKVITNCATGTQILHVEASFNSAERGLQHAEDLELNLSQMLHSF